MLEQNLMISEIGHFGKNRILSILKPEVMYYTSELISMSAQRTVLNLPKILKDMNLSQRPNPIFVWFLKWKIFYQDPIKFLCAFWIWKPFTRTQFNFCVLFKLETLSQRHNQTFMCFLYWKIFHKDPIQFLNINFENSSNWDSNLPLYSVPGVVRFFHAMK